MLTISANGRYRVYTLMERDHVFVGIDDGIQITESMLTRSAALKLAKAIERAAKEKAKGTSK